MKNRKLVYCLTALACVCCINCENPIMKEWWKEPEPGPKDPEVEYVSIVKMIPQVTYETLIEHEFIYKDIFVQLPPDVIYETIVQEVTVTKEVPVYIYETIIEKVPEYIYETVTEYETIYETIIQEVEKIVHDPPTEDDIIQYIKDHPAEVIEIIKQVDNWKEILKEIIKEIPPDEIVNYLTDEQIKYIINQQPPEIILQTITIIDIEYIIFAGNAIVYNGPHGTGANTDLTTEEKNSNNATIAAMAQALKDHPDYLMILHGHANPTTTDPNEIAQLKQISEDRADDVDRVLKDKYLQLGGDVTGWDTRVSANGYGGEKNISVTNSTYAGLNRRVEMILVRVGVE